MNATLALLRYSTGLLDSPNFYDIDFLRAAAVIFDSPTRPQARKLQDLMFRQWPALGRGRGNEVRGGRRAPRQRNSFEVSPLFALRISYHWTNFDF